MTDTPASQPAETPPVDRRPRPQYGELAPEGWTWEPPVSGAASGTSPSTAAGLPVTPTAAPGAAPETAPPVPGVPAWDRVVTLSLLIFGVMATLVTIAMFIELPNALQTVYTQQGLGTYEPAASVPMLVLVGQISAGLLWAATVAASITMMVRRRRTFYVPIIGGVVAGIVLIAIMATILNADPALLEVLAPV